MAPSARLPESVSKWVDPFVLCAVMVVAYVLFSRSTLSNQLLAALVVAAVIVVMTLLEWWRAPKHGAKHSIRENLAHSAITWLGTLAGFALVMLVWGILAEYRASYYAPFFAVLPLVLMLTPIVTAFFIIAADSILGPSIRGGYQLGLLAIGRAREVDWVLLRNDAIMWFIRFFFLPINFCELVWAIGSFRGNEIQLLSGSFVASEYYLLIMVYAAIIAAVTPGYLFGSRLIRTDTKAVSHSWFDWTVTLACYSPFEAAVFVNWFNFSPNSPNPAWMQPWATQLQSVPLLLAVAGAAIFFFSLIHLWGEAQFGLRASNLSNRGIITTGPFRVCKHPIYASKCIVWLLIWMPFMSGIDVIDNIRLTVLWACVCGIFALRSLAEERLLSTDPDYVAYALWIDRHGVSKYISRLIPALSFEWRLAYWQKTITRG